MVCALPRVPFNLLLVAEFQEAWADPAWQPGTQAVEEPLEGAKTDGCDEQDQLAEGVHGHLGHIKDGGE